jgi:regulatory protein
MTEVIQQRADDKRQMTEKRQQQAGDSYRKAFNAALRLLARRDHSKLELAQKLKQRDFDSEVIEKVFLECERLNYLNDDRTARVYIEQLFRRGYGARRILAELKRKGLKGGHVAGLLNEIVPDDRERENAERMLAKNMSRFDREVDRQKRKAKIYRFLLAKGYSGDVIAKVMKKY